MTASAVVERLSALSRRPGPLLYLGSLAALSVAAGFVPLFDHLGYELTELVALWAGLFGAAPGVAALRTELWRNSRSNAAALLAALIFALAALALPVAIILLHGLRRPLCDPLAGLVLYVALALPSALLAVALGAACASLAPRHTGPLIGCIFLLTLAVALWPVAKGPQVFVFHHLGGMFPGPLYDEAIRPSRALWAFRACTLLYAGSCAGVALFRSPAHAEQRIGVALFLCAPCALFLSLQAERLHWKASAALVDRELGGRFETRHLALHFPREKAEEERKLLAQDAESSYRAVRAFAQLPAEGGPRIEVWLYRSKEEKQRLLGAAETSFAKPWLRQVHLNDAPTPHPVLRHELAHAVLAEVARGPFRVPGRLRGLVPDMALIEGAAVAADWPLGEFTIHEEARALRTIGWAPAIERIFSPALFYAESGPRAYVTAGSFLRWLWETRGSAAVREAYGSPRGIAALGDLRAFADAHRSFLDALPPSPRAQALAEQRFAAPGIVGRHCAREVAKLDRDAAAAAARGAHALAAKLWAKCARLEPDDPALLLRLRRAQIAAGDRAGANATEERALHHAKLTGPQRAQLLVESGDAAWRSGDAAAAAARYTEAARLAQPEAQERALAARRIGLADPEAWPALRRLLAESDAGPETWLALKELDMARTRDGFAAYLLAKQLQNRGDFATSARYAREALARSLPGSAFEIETLRMLGIASWHLGDAAGARGAFEKLAHGATPGRAVEAARWLELISTEP